MLRQIFYIMIKMFMFVVAFFPIGPVVDVISFI